MISFEVQIFRDGSGWGTESHWDLTGRAMAHARALLATRRYQGVRVVESRLDESTGIFREKTLMTRFRHGRGPGKSKPRPDPVRPLVQIRPETPALRNAAVLCFGILVCAVIGLFVAGGAPGLISTPAEAGRVTYDLPSITATLQGNGAPRAVRVHVSLELRDKEDIAGVERSLAQIVNVVIDGLETFDPRLLHAEAELEEVRAQLHSSIQSVARDARIQDVAFKKIQPF
jgi:flagellar basal body-associated protein FliL